MKKAIVYYCVSSDQQGQSGLGIEAQQQSVRAYATAHQLELSEELTEIESGKKNKRPVLLQALDLCRKNKAVLVIAKLDRLGRNGAFISSLMEAKVEFVAVDNPHANKLMLHMLAAFAEHEREQISTRTKEALAAAKRRGVRLGENSKILSVKNRKAADEFALQMAPVIAEIRQEGYVTVRDASGRTEPSESACQPRRSGVAFANDSGVVEAMPIKYIGHDTGKIINFVNYFA